MRAAFASGLTASRREADSSSEVTCAHFGGIDTHGSPANLMSRMLPPELLSRPPPCKANFPGQSMKQLPCNVGACTARRTSQVAS